MSTDLDPDSEALRPPRPSIEERAKRRAEMDATDRDRYDSLLRHLRAGQEIAVQPRAGWRDRLGDFNWHPIAGKLILAAVLIAAAYVGLTAAAAWWREGLVETWTGPDASVQSGQRLDDCPSLIRLDDAVLPNWIRYRGEVFQLSEAVVPMGASNIGTYYIETPWSLGDLRLFEVTVEGLGPIGSRLAVRNGEAPAGQLYRRVDACS